MGALWPGEKKARMDALAALRTLLRQRQIEDSRRMLSTAGALVRVDAKLTTCSLCSGPTKVQKSTPHNIATLEHGRFVALETVRVCAGRCRRPDGGPWTMRCQSLSQRVAPGNIDGYDVEVYVGRQRYLSQNSRQREEIRESLLREYGIQRSSGQISALAIRFLRHLAALHDKKAAVLRLALAKDGGYGLHIDATGEDGRGTLLVAYAGKRQWVLGSWKISTERAELVKPRLREVTRSFGAPLGIMRDFGRAMIQATQALAKELPGKIKVFGCHQHFLRVVGTALLEARYDELRNLVRQHRLKPKLRALARDIGRPLSDALPALREDMGQWLSRATCHELPSGPAGLAMVRSLAQWVLDSDQDGSHLGFPFDQHFLDFYRRCHKLRRATDAFLRTPHPDAHVQRNLKHLARLLEPVVRDKTFAAVAAILLRRANLFDELRTALRLHTSAQSNIRADRLLSPQRAAAELQDIRRAVECLKRSLHRRRPQRGPAHDMRDAIDIVLRQLKRHGSFLWGHAIPLPKKAGGGLYVMDRTNNLLEGFFHKVKHQERRRSGRKVLTYDFERLPPEATLALNLLQPDYVELLCGSLDKLPQAFAELDAEQRSAKSTASTSVVDRPTEPQLLSASLPSSDRRFLRLKSLSMFIEAAARSRAPNYEFTAP